MLCGNPRSFCCFDVLATSISAFFFSNASLTSLIFRLRSNTLWDLGPVKLRAAGSAQLDCKSPTNDRGTQKGVGGVHRGKVRAEKNDARVSEIASQDPATPCVVLRAHRFSWQIPVIPARDFICGLLNSRTSGPYCSQCGGSGES